MVPRPLAGALGAAALGADFLAAGFAGAALGAFGAGFASAFFAFGADANFSRICRTTGGSSEGDDDLTNSPASFR